MNYRIDNLQYCNWSREVFQINKEAGADTEDGGVDVGDNDGITRVPSFAGEPMVDPVDPNTPAVDTDKQDGADDDINKT